MTTATRKAPSDFVQECGDHSIITLSKPAKIAGIEVSFLRMREPTAGDMAAYQDMPGSDGAKEMHTFCSLCQIAPEELRALPFRDYGRLQAAFALFTI